MVTTKDTTVACARTATRQRTVLYGSNIQLAYCWALSYRRHQRVSQYRVPPTATGGLISVELLFRDNRGADGGILPLRKGIGMASQVNYDVALGLRTAKQYVAICRRIDWARLVGNRS